jgi:hypothetical protein
MSRLPEQAETGAGADPVGETGRRALRLIRADRAFLVSVAIHVVVLWIAGMIVFTAMADKTPAVIACQTEARERFFDDTDNSQLRTPEVSGNVEVKPIVYAEEEASLTHDLPRGFSTDHLSNKNLEADSCVDAYGIGTGRAGAYGANTPRKVLESESCGMSST